MLSSELLLVSVETDCAAGSHLGQFFTDMDELAFLDLFEDQMAF